MNIKNRGGMQNQVALNNKDSNAEKTLWMYFMECITQKYFCFNGRARRKEFFGYLLFRFLIVIGVDFILSLIGLSEAIVDVLMDVLVFLFLIPDFAVLIRRIHDVGFSAWWAFIPCSVLGGLILTPLVLGYVFPGFVYLVTGLFIFVPFVVVFIKSDSKKNQYGPVPDGTY